MNRGYLYLQHNKERQEQNKRYSQKHGKIVNLQKRLYNIKMRFEKKLALWAIN